jgi:hypothetical protein
MQDNELPRIVKILLHLLQRRDLELKTAATSFLIRLYAQVERGRERETVTDTHTHRQREGEGEGEGERCTQMGYSRQALVLGIVLRMKLDQCDG